MVILEANSKFMPIFISPLRKMSRFEMLMDEEGAFLE